jgi:hypothetical protein
MGLRVEDQGESEGRAVMVRIGVEPRGDITPPRKRADFPVVSAGVKCQSTGAGSDADMSAGVQCPIAGATAAIRVISVAGPAASNAQVDPKTNGATAVRKGCRRPAEPCRIVSRRAVVRGLSRMKRKFHVRFLGEGVAATPLSYPALRTPGGILASLPQRLPSPPAPQSYVVR